MTEKIQYIPARLKNASVGGHVAGSDDIMDDDLQLTQKQINAIVLGDAVSVSLAASPTAVFVGEAVNIALAATSSTTANTIKIKKGSTVLVTGTNKTTQTYTHNLTPISGNNAYSAEFVIGGLTKIATKNVVGVYPIRIGSGADYVEGTPLTTPKASPAGSYNVTVAENAQYVYFNVPATMTIHGATLNGFDFPLEDSTNVTIGGIAYKSYRSSNTNDAGTYTIAIS